MREGRKGCLKIGIALMTATLFWGGMAEKKVEARPRAKTIRVDAAANLLINKKEKKRLTIKVTPKKASKAVRWSSSRKKVVSVTKKGVICGKRYGKATITARALDGSGKRAKIRVQVGRKVEKIEIASQTLSLDVGAKTSVKPNITPANASRKKIMYTSSDKDVVSVSSTGVVTAKTKGSATITIRTTDGSGKKQVCRVQSIIPSQSVTVNTDKKERRISTGENLQINAAVQPTNASNTAIRFVSTNPAVASVSEFGKVTGVAPGTTTIRVDAADGRSTASIEVEVYKMELKDEKLIAHRGFSSKAPENTTAAFQLAVDNGFWGVECDVRKTLDDEFVIMHDADLSRMCGKSWSVENLDITQLKNCNIISGSNVEQYPDLKVPTLNEYLEIVAGSKTIHPFIELKVEFTEEELTKLVELVDGYGLLQRAYFISLHTSNLLKLKEIPGVKKDQLQYVYGAESENKTMAVNTQVIDWCIQNAIDLDARHTLITAADVARLQAAGRKVNVWTVKTLEDAYNLVTNCKVDMITTEYMLNS